MGETRLTSKRSPPILWSVAAAVVTSIITSLALRTPLGPHDGGSHQSRYAQVSLPGAVNNPDAIQGAEPWSQAPEDVVISIQLPTWAGCTRPRCKYSRLAEATIDPNTVYATHHSQDAEDTWVYNNFFFNKVNGTFLEMGALDGVALSNTLWMNKAAGWRGLLVEPNPDQFKKLVVNRLDSIVVNAALCDKFQTVHFALSPHPQIGGIWEFMSESFKDRWHPGKTVDQLPLVPCVPLQFVLDRVGMHDIDFWSLDVEGAELQVLQTVDFSLNNIRTMVVEVDGNDPKKDAQVIDILLKAGFLIAHQVPKRNVFLVHESFVSSLSKRPELAKLQLRATWPFEG